MLNWDNSIPDPSAKAPVLTGILADGADAEKVEKEYTVSELESGKPLLVYYVRQGMTDASHPEYKFSQSFEVKVLANGPTGRMFTPMRTVVVSMLMASMTVSATS